MDIAQEIQDRRIESIAYNNIGVSYQLLGEHRKAIEFGEKRLAIAQEIQDPLGECSAYNNIGTCYQSLGQYQQAIEFYEKYLTIAQQIKYRLGQGNAYCNLGEAYRSLGQYRQAIEFYEKYLAITQEIKKKDSEGRAYFNLGNAYRDLKNYPKAEDCYRQSITIRSSLQEDLGNNPQWKISIFEGQAKVYLSLEELLLEQHQFEKALEVTDSRRSRALISTISKRLSSRGVTLSNTSLSPPEMQTFASQLNTTFVLYSLSSFKEDTPSEIHKITGCWIIPPQGEGAIIFHPLAFDTQVDPSTHLARQLQSLITTIKVDVFDLPNRGDTSDDEAELNAMMSDTSLQQEAHSELIQKNNEQAERKKKALQTLQETHLKTWYSLLIAPLEKHLPPPGSSQTLTLIPDGPLSQLPFGAFCDPHGTYLIEKWALSFAPSMKTLQLLHQFPSHFPSTSLVVGNPHTGLTQENLAVADKEAQDVRALLQLPEHLILRQTAATWESVTEKMQQARFLHLACHGLDQKKFDQHWVFEGLFKLSPTPDHPDGSLYAQQIVALQLQAELVFLSACYSGKGNVRKEGSIGPVWSFLGSGALSTVATYWPLPDTDETLQIVKTFYQTLLHQPGSNKAEALRQAILPVLQKDRDHFVQWAAFFLSGRAQPT